MEKDKKKCYFTLKIIVICLSTYRVVKMKKNHLKQRFLHETVVVVIEKQMDSNTCRGAYNIQIVSCVTTYKTFRRRDFFNNTSYYYRYKALMT